MNLRQNVLITLAAAFLVIILLLLLSSWYILSSYGNLESGYVNHEVHLVRSLFSSQSSALFLLAKDWGAWDDTYRFVSGTNPGFVAANLDPESIPNLQLNVLIITNDRGQPVYSTGYDTSSGKSFPVPKELFLELDDPSSPLRDIHSADGTAGYYLLPDGVIILVAHPVIHSDNTGPPAGMVIMGRYIDDAMLGKIETTTNHSVRIIPLPMDFTPFPQKRPQGVPGIVEETRISSGSTDNPDSPVQVRPLNGTTVMGSTILEDIRGNDAFLLIIEMPRDIYLQGESTLRSFLVIFITIALIIGIIVIRLVDRLVLIRLDTINRDLDALGRQGDLSQRLTVEGNDEISHLIASMNGTFDQLENAQKDLQKSEINFRTLIGTSPTNIVQTDITGTVTFANLQMAISHGYNTADEIRGKVIFDFISSEDHERFMENLHRTIPEGQIKNIEYLGVKRDGSRIWLEVSTSVITSPDGQPGSFIIISRDISRRKLRDDQIRESEKRYRTVFENTGTATVLIDETGILSLINSEFERLSGFPRADIEGKMQWTDFVSPEDLGWMQELHNRRRSDPTAALKKYEFRFIGKSGAVRYILLSVDLIPGTKTSIAALIDITDRKKAEETIIESENKLNTIIDSSPIPLFVIDRNHHVLHWNKALEHLSGIPAEHVLGTNCHWMAFYKHPRPCMADLVSDGIIEQVSEYQSGKYTRSSLKEGQYDVTDFFPDLGEAGKWLYCTATCTYDNARRVTGAIEMFVDITEQKTIEEKVIRTNEQLKTALQDLRKTEEMLNNKICELEDAKGDLTRSEARYRDIATNIPGIVFQFIVRRKDCSKVPFTCETAFSLFTLGPDEVYSSPNALFSLIHTEDSVYARNTLQESAQTLEPWNIEFRMKPRGNDIRWFNGRAVPHMLDTGDVVWHGVLIDITERKIAEIALVESEQKFRGIFDQTFQFMGLMTPDGTLIQANRTAIEQSGRPEAEIIGKPFWETPWWTHSAPLQARLKTAIKNVAAGDFERFEATHPGPDGSTIFVDFSLKPVKDKNGTVVFLIPEGRDITEQKLLQEKIGTALKEKELLLKEIHHRVKNNIQVIASLLNMQARVLDDPATKEVLREAQNRVKSIALVHEKLYQSKNLDRIDYQDYLQKIARHLFDSYGVSQRNIAIHIHADNIILHIDKAVPCSLIINELLSNALKHAFPADRKGEIWITIHKDGQNLVLNYRDNGVGLPENISIEQSESLGMRLLQGLTRQLHGTITFQRLGGTQITITFPYGAEPGENP